MNAHVLFHLLDKLRKSDTMQGFPSLVSLFCNEFNKFNNTRARTLHVDLFIIWNQDHLKISFLALKR